MWRSDGARASRGSARIAASRERNPEGIKRRSKGNRHPRPRPGLARATHAGTIDLIRHDPVRGGELGAGGKYIGPSFGWRDMTLNVVIGSSKPGDHGPLQAALGRKGIEASVFSDGAALIEAARVRDPDLVVVDLHLGGLHGIEVARSLAGQRASILVDEDEAAISDLKRLGLEVRIRRARGEEVRCAR